MTNQNCVTGSDDNEIVNSKQRDRRAALVENDVIRRIQSCNGAIARVSLFVALEIVCDCTPTADVIPIEVGFDYRKISWIADPAPFRK